MTRDKRPDPTPENDPLEDLRAAMEAATPAPDPSLRGAHLAQAEEAFKKFHADTQGSAKPTRPNSDRPTMGGLFKGVGQMLSTLTARPALTASTALVAVGLVALIPVLQDGPPSVLQPVGGLTETTEVRERDQAATDDRAVAPEPVVEPAPMIVAEEAEALVDGLVAADAPPPAALARPNAKRVEGYAAGLPVVDTEIAPPPTEANTEAFANEDPNPVKIAADEPVSTFSVDVDTASYSVVRQSLMSGHLPPADAVRIEEMVNYFPYSYPAPDADNGPFRPTVTVTPTPWNEGTRLMHIALQGRMPAIEDRPALNLVFLIDTSGSMDDPSKLPLLKQSFRLMLSELSPQDEVSIVTYAGSAGRVLDPTPASDRATILAALDRLGAGGSTAGQAGLQQAYATAEAMAAEGEISRVILATDGDFNVGLSDPEALKDFIADKRDSGTYLSVLGFGRGNLDDATMQALAQNGNGQAAYIDTLSEARKVLVDQLTGALFPIANDVKIQVEFNPATVAEYRLIGYETRALNREDFNNDRVDAGEIGAGHSVTAIYEVTPVGSDAVLNDPLRYSASAETVQPGTGVELAFLRLRWKEPGEETSQLMELPITDGMGAVNDDTRFAAAIAGFGQLLRDGKYLGRWGWTDAITLAEDARGDDAFGYRREAVTLMRLAESLSQ